MSPKWRSMRVDSGGLKSLNAVALMEGEARVGRQPEGQVLRYSKVMSLLIEQPSRRLMLDFCPPHHSRPFHNEQSGRSWSWSCQLDGSSTRISAHKPAGPAISHCAHTRSEPPRNAHVAFTLLRHPRQLDHPNPIYPPTALEQWRPTSWTSYTLLAIAWCASPGRRSSRSTAEASRSSDC